MLSVFILRSGQVRTPKAKGTHIMSFSLVTVAECQMNHDVLVNTKPGFFYRGRLRICANQQMDFCKASLKPSLCNESFTGRSALLLGASNNTKMNMATRTCIHKSGCGPGLVRKRLWLGCGFRVLGRKHHIPQRQKHRKQETSDDI